MIRIRKANERGRGDHGWLTTFHSFSFADYYDERHMGFSSLRVINDDRISGNSGFPTHAHRDMEIITLILEGELEHKDSMGNGSIIRRGDVQRMSAGTGVRHSEFNPSPIVPAHLLQIWILPDDLGLTPSYEQKSFSEEQRNKQLVLVGSTDGRDGSVTVHQDIGIYAGTVSGDAEREHSLRPGRKAWLHVAEGSVTVNGRSLAAGDAAAFEKETAVHLSRGTDANVLLFDLA